MARRLEQEAQVLRDANGAYLLASPAGCAACDGGCGLAPSVRGDRRLRRLAERADGIAAGSRLLLGVSAAGLTRVAALTFGAPLVLLLSAAALGSHAGGETIGMLAGMAALVLGLGSIWRWGGRLVPLLELSLGVQSAARDASSTPDGRTHPRCKDTGN